MKRLSLFVALAVALSAFILPRVPAHSSQPDQLDVLQTQLENITLPPGFEISVFAYPVPGARSLEWTPNNTLFVGTRQAGIVYALRDDDYNGQADGVMTIAQGLYQPNGVAFRDGALYVAEITRILRYDNIEANLSNPPEPVVVMGGLPDAHHGWKFLRFGPDDRLYFQIGAPCNICNENDPRYATIVSIDPANSADFQIYASGVRNSVGMDWHPETGELWFTDNGRDSMGDDLPPDELNHAPEAGLHFGFPFCHAGTIPDPGFGGLRACSEFTPPALTLSPHGAALGMRFYTGEQFPEDYLNQIFIAEHGSWDRSVPIGYRIMLARLNEDEEAVAYEPFAEGWLVNGRAWGRPVDVEQLPDGSILVSDDAAGAIYRIRYVGESE